MDWVSKSHLGAEAELLNDSVDKAGHSSQTRGIIMTAPQSHQEYRSIFAPSTAKERKDNFESYWVFSQRHAGALIEDQQDLENKRAKLRALQADPVRSRQPLPDPELFYRNYAELKDDPKTFDRKTLLLSCIYKFARHEWVGISGAWEATPTFAKSKAVTDKISRYHLAEEFSHVRLFHEMFRTFHLDRVEWHQPGPMIRKMYEIFPRFPEAMMAAPAFISELMGMTFYLHVDRLFDDILADEPEARDRLRELLHEIMVDELAHIGQRRNYCGALDIQLAKKIIVPMNKLLFRDIPESKLLLDVDQMIADGLAFDYSTVSQQLIDRSWVPTYCQ